jgi:GT2 family glycosyltransferase
MHRARANTRGPVTRAMPFSPIKVMDVELAAPPADVTGLDGYAAVLGLVRIHGTPIGYVGVPVRDGRCPAASLLHAALAHHARAVVRHLLEDALRSPRREGLRIADLLEAGHPRRDGPWPLVTVAVCTRDRTEDLARCLDALTELDYPALDLLVVDNAPASDATERLVRSRDGRVRYVREPRPGLDWARSRAIAEARGEIIAYTDDDAVVDRGWVRAIAAVFADAPEVMAVTGLVVPYELETEAQWLFEAQGGFGRGFERRWYRLDRHAGERAARRYRGLGQFGTGANMAFRRSLFSRIGGFDPALDVGTVTNGAGDLEMYFRVLHHGETLVYEPNAIVRHRHRRRYADLRTQIANNGVSYAALLERNTAAYPRDGLRFIANALWWLWRWNVRPVLGTLLWRGPVPADLFVAQITGTFRGLGRYRRARRDAAAIAAAHAAAPEP